MILSELLECDFQNKKDIISTGFFSLDRIIGGLNTGYIATIAGRPGMGKTAFAISLLREIGIYQQIPTAYISLELNEFEIVKRLQASITGVWENDNPDQSNQARRKEVAKIFEDIGFECNRKEDSQQKSLELMKKAPVWIEHNIGSSIDEIINHIEILHKENHVRVVFLDNMSWILPETTKKEQTQDIIKLQKAAKRLNVSIVLITTLSSSIERRGEYMRPELCDLNDWGHLETESFSSMVFFVYRPEYYKIEMFEDYLPSSNMVEIMVKKNRFGNTGSVYFHFDHHCGFTELQPDEEYELKKQKLYENDSPF